MAQAAAGAGRATRVTFAPTPPLSSYLVAVIVGTLAASEPLEARGIPIRTWTVPDKRHLTAFAQEAAAAVLPRLEDYFGLPYPFGKLDQIGVPDFEAGAMENAGAITFREVALLLDPATAPLAVQKRVAEVITHELAHQWFGNLVTARTWSEAWLHEGFATYAEHLWDEHCDGGDAAALRRGAWLEQSFAEDARNPRPVVYGVCERPIELSGWNPGTARKYLNTL